MKRYIPELLATFQGHCSELQATVMNVLKKNSILKYNMITLLHYKYLQYEMYLQITVLNCLWMQDIRADIMLFSR